jgi:signal transduction histidine kinase
LQSDQLIGQLQEALGDKVETLVFKEGEFLIKEGDESPVFIITKGQCKVFILDKKGGEIILSKLDRGNTVGDMSNFTKEKTVANVSAESDVEVLKIDTDHFEDLMAGVPPYVQTLYTQLCSRLENTNANLSKKVNELLFLNENLNNLVAEQVSDIKEKNEALEKKNLELEDMTKDKDRFLNIAVHDLRSPLSCIVGYLDLLNVMPGIQNDSDLNKMSKIISKNCSGMFDLINDILDISKINNGSLELDIDEINIHEVIQECFETNVILCEKKNIKLIQTIEEPISMCLADKRRVIEILNNLVSNALKFSNRDTEITIKAKQKENEDFLWVHVIDQGQGVEKSELETLFQAFHQTSTVSTEGEKGTGLGLAIVKKLVDLQNGKIEVSSEVGVGSDFKFSLPTA